MYKKILLYTGGVIVFIIILASLGTDNVSSPASQNTVRQDEVAILASTTDHTEIAESKAIVTNNNLYSVTNVVDGDTIDVSIDGKVERLRLIGINTPETVDPRKPVECFGVEASQKAKSLLTGKKVYLENDITQGELDKYNRLLRYVFLEDGTSFNLMMIKEGYAYEYTYDIPYKYQTEFKNAQKEAMASKAGLWGDLCNGLNTIATSSTQTNDSPGECTIKGNISSTKEKIYHMIGCGSYAKTTIDESKGERWFCTEKEAQDAGWRKALNCN